MNKKEIRWGAAQARIRTEMKQLRDHNAALKEELKELTFSKVIQHSFHFLKHY